MLNLTFYKNVPLQSSYANVVLFNSTSDVLAYLSQYQEGTLDNINKFFSNETFIDVPQYFEGCNYLCIQDTRSTAKEYKFFFIENVQFISGGAVRYSLIMDVWATWSYDIQFKPSRMIAGHLDAFNVSGVKRSLVSAMNGETEININNYLVKPFTTQGEYDATFVAVIATDTKIFTMFKPVKSHIELWRANANLQGQQFRNVSETNFKTFEILNTYLINSFDLQSKLDNVYSGGTFYYEVILDNTTDYRMYMLTPISLDNPSVVVSHFDIEINSKLMFDNETEETKIEKLYKKYRIGTFTNNQEIFIDSETNPRVTLILYIYDTMQICILLKCENVEINLTNDFEIPFKNDSFTLYMAQNKALFDANNKSNALGLATSTIASRGTAILSLLLAPATGGASALVGAGFATGTITSGVNFGVQRIKQEAQIERASKTIDRLDSVNTSALITLNYGVGVFEISFKNLTDTRTNTNNFGTIQKIFINDYVASQTSLYNFYFVQFDDINIYGEFTYNIKSILENIFTNGVRIWCDTSQYLNNVNYKK